MRSRSTVAAVGIVAAIVLALSAASVALVLAGSRPDLDLPTAIGAISLVLAGVVFGGTALLILVARPGNRIGWLLLAASVAITLMAFGSEYRRYAALHPSALSAVDAVGHASDIGWLVTVTLLFLLLQLFPTGRSLGGAWRVLAAATAAWPAILTPLQIVATEHFDNGRLVPNPDALEGPVGAIATVLLLPVTQALVPLFILSVVALVARYRGAGAIERLQLKWMVFAAVVTFAVLGLTGTSSSPLPRGAWTTAAQNLLLLVAFPAAIAIAVLRYRLFEIDLLINRTLVYGGVSATLLATYFGVVVLLQTLLRPFTSGSELAVAGSTLLVVALFQPLRRRVQAAVDQRFYRSRYDAARTLDAFSARLRDDVELESVRADLLGVVGETVRPAHASLWLRGPGR